MICKIIFTSSICITISVLVSISSLLFIINDPTILTTPPTVAEITFSSAIPFDNLVITIVTLLTTISFWYSSVVSLSPTTKIQRLFQSTIPSLIYTTPWSLSSFILMGYSWSTTHTFVVCWLLITTITTYIPCWISSQNSNRTDQDIAMITWVAFFNYSHYHRIWYSPSGAAIYNLQSFRNAVLVILQSSCYILIDLIDCYKYTNYVFQFDSLVQI